MKGRSFWGILAVCGCFGLILCGCGQKQTVSEYATLKEQAVATLSDGSKVDCWETDFLEYYCLEDGTELLSVRTPSGPKDHFVMGLESFADLPPQAQEAVEKYYNQQGALYDLQSELEAAYDEYLQKQQEKERYHTRILEQETVPTASGEDVIYFSTMLTLPVGDQMVEQYRFSAAFDRQTGEKLNVWSLFTVPKEEVLDVFFSKNMIFGEERRQMEEALRDEWMVFSPDSLGMEFPKGSLAGVDASMGVYLDFDQGLEEWLVPGALPKESQTATNVK